MCHRGQAWKVKDFSGADHKKEKKINGLAGAAPAVKLLKTHTFFFNFLLAFSLSRAHNYLMKNIARKLPEAGGWVGMGLIHSATLPTTLSAIMGWGAHFPPISMVVMVWAGLALFFVRALSRIDWLYLFSNGVGFTLQSILLYLIVKG